MILRKKPKGSIRVVKIFGWCVPVFLILSYFDYNKENSFSPYALILLCGLLVGISIPEFIRIIKVKNKMESKLFTVLVSLGVAVAIITLLALNELNIFVWNGLYISVPILLYSFVINTVCFIAEDRHNIHVYMALDGYHFVRA